MKAAVENGRTHEPNLRELVADLDGLAALTEKSIAAMRTLMDERHALYAERDTTRKEMIQTALVAQEKLVNAAFAASKEAIMKAEESQKGVNERSNEFRAQLGDQANTLMPRAETEALLRDIRDRLDTGRNTSAAALEELKKESRAENDKLRNEINGLRESRSEGSGRQSQQTEGQKVNQWAISAVLAAAGLLIGVLGSGVLSRQPPQMPPVNIYQSQPPNGNTGMAIDPKSTTRTQP